MISTHIRPDSRRWRLRRVQPGAASLYALAPSRSGERGRARARAGHPVLHQLIEARGWAMSSEPAAAAGGSPDSSPLPPQPTPEQKRREQALALYAQRKAAETGDEVEDKLTKLRAFKGMAKQKIDTKKEQDKAADVDSEPEPEREQHAPELDAEARRLARLTQLSRPQPTGRRLPLKVHLHGVSLVAGGPDGWTSERIAVFNIQIVCQGRVAHSFSERFSGALEKHERMVSKQLKPLCNIQFPSYLGEQLKGLDDLASVARRGAVLEAYYTEVVDAATPEEHGAARALVYELYGVAWPTVATMTSEFSWPMSMDVPREPDEVTPLASDKLVIGEPDELIKQFDEIDLNKNGELDWKEVQLAVSMLFPGDHEAALQHAYDVADADQDGVITRSEFVVLVEYMVYFNNIWHAFDVNNGDGSQEIGVSEFAEGCDMLGIAVTPAEAAASHWQIQQTKPDGRVTFDDFCIWCAKGDAALNSTGGEIVVTFTESGTLGLTFREVLNLGIEILEVVPATQASEHKELRPGLLLNSVDGGSVDGRGDISRLLQSRPVTLGFVPGLTVAEKLQGEDAWRARKQRMKMKDGASTAGTTISVPTNPSSMVPAQVWQQEDAYEPKLALHNRGGSMAVTVQLPKESHWGGGNVHWYRWRPTREERLRAALKGGAEVVFEDGVFRSGRGCSAAAAKKAAAAAAAAQAVASKKVVFGKPRDLDLRLSSDDPLDQLWLKVDADGDGQLGKSELAELMVMMGRASTVDAPETATLVDKIVEELDTDRSGDIDIGEFQEWYNQQPERKISTASGPMPVRIASCGAYAASRKLRKGMCVLSINGTDTRAMSLREVDRLIKVAGRPLTMEFDPRAVHVQDKEIEARRMRYAASRIQAIHRGKLARRQVAAMRDAVKQKADGGTSPVTDSQPLQAAVNTPTKKRVVQYVAEAGADGDGDGDGDGDASPSKQIGTGRDYTLSERDSGYFVGCTVECSLVDPETNRKMYPDLHLDSDREVRQGWLGYGIYREDGTMARFASSS